MKRAPFIAAPLSLLYAAHSEISLESVRHAILLFGAIAAISVLSCAILALILALIFAWLSPRVRRDLIKLARALRSPRQR